MCFTPLVKPLSLLNSSPHAHTHIQIVARDQTGVMMDQRNSQVLVATRTRAEIVNVCGNRRNRRQTFSHVICDGRTCAEIDGRALRRAVHVTLRPLLHFDLLDQHHDPKEEECMFWRNSNIFFGRLGTLIYLSLDVSEVCFMHSIGDIIEM